jgi:hypothetical protein
MLAEFHIYPYKLFKLKVPMKKHFHSGQFKNTEHIIPLFSFEVTAAAT